MIESERTTGATDAQIEAAVKRCMKDYPGDSSPLQLAYMEAREWAEYVVPAGQVIVEAARVPSDEELAAFARIADWLDARVRLDVALDDDAVEAGEQMGSYLAAYWTAHDAVSPDDGRTIRAYLERQGRGG